MRYRDSIELDPMIPSERRIVHLTLAEHESVTTHSEGEGDNRRVSVEPTADYVAQHGGPVERPERMGDRGGRGGGFSRGGRGGGGGGGAGGRGPGRLRRWRWRWLSALTGMAEGPDSQFERQNIDYLLIGHVTVDRLEERRVAMGGTATYASVT